MMKNHNFLYFPPIRLFSVLCQGASWSATIETGTVASVYKNGFVTCPLSGSFVKKYFY